MHQDARSYCLCQLMNSATESPQGATRRTEGEHGRFAGRPLPALRTIRRVESATLAMSTKRSPLFKYHPFANP